MELSKPSTENLAVHLERFYTETAARVSPVSATHIYRNAAVILLSWCGFKSIGDIDAVRVQAALHQRCTRSAPLAIPELPPAQVAALGNAHRRVYDGIRVGLSMSEIAVSSFKGKTSKATDAERGLGKVFDPPIDIPSLRRRARGMSLVTANEYLKHARQFCKWLHHRAVIATNPLATLKPYRIGRGDRRHVRRALSTSELATLLATARVAPDLRGIAGKERALLYTLAAYTGLRVNELRQLARSAFNFTSDPPTVTVPATMTKDRREDVLPLKADVASALRAHVEGQDDECPVFKIPISGYPWLYIDLAAAGIPRRTDAGVIDLFALRHTFAAMLARTGARIGVILKLMRCTHIARVKSEFCFSRDEQVRALAALPPIAGTAGAASGEEPNATP